MCRYSLRKWQAVIKIKKRSVAWLYNCTYVRQKEGKCPGLKNFNIILKIVKWCADSLCKWHGSYQNKKTHFCRTIVQLCVCTKKKKANVLGLQISTSYLKLWSDVQIVFANDMADFENEKANAKYFLRTPVNCNYVELWNTAETKAKKQTVQW